MPEWAVILLSAAIGGGAGGLVTLAGIRWQIRLQQREFEEKYRAMTFPERLAAHQKAFYWCRQLSKILIRLDAREILEIAESTRDWWNQQCFYLDPKSRKLMINVTDDAYFYACWLDMPPEDRTVDSPKVAQHILQSLVETMKTIVEGVGAEYLPEMQQDATQDTMK